MVLQYHGFREMDSCDSFEVSQALTLFNPSILEESISIDSLSSTSTGPSLPFPPRRMVPIPPILFERSSSMYLSSNEKTHEGEQMTITITIPTPPRITKMLTEPLCVSKWVESLVGSHPPGHIPWGDVEYGKSISWIPEGSIYPPDAFSKALLIARKPRRVNSDVFSPPVMFISNPGPTRGRSASEHRTSFRRALVFEQEITLNTGGKTKRWSLQVPATTMNPEMVDMMLELQDLNSFFKDGLDDLDQSVAFLGQQKEWLEPPSLMVSDSHCVFPLSLESSGDLTQDNPITLATRRGKVSPAPISVGKCTLDTAYPSIPTAFLGSPSVYSPKFEFANAPDEHTMDLEDMVANLRSQCITLQAHPQPQSDLVCPAGSPTSEFGDETDDWAFSNSLLGAFSSPTFSTPCNGDPPSPSEHQVSGDSITWNSEDITVSTSLVSILPGFYSPGKSLGSPSALSNYVPAIPLPLTPPHTASIPSSPPHTLSPSHKEVRGILKSCKNVRFASLPGRQESVDVTSLVFAPHRSTDPASGSPLQRPSRMRTVPLPKPRETKENMPTFVPSRAAPSPMPKILSLSGVGVPTLISPPSTLESPQTKATIVKQGPRSLGRQRATSLQKPTPVSLGRNSPKNQEGGSKARRMSFTPRTTTSSRWTINEMPFRRGSNASQQDSGSPKSRMPVPLRNILTRFK